MAVEKTNEPVFPTPERFVQIIDGMVRELRRNGWIHHPRLKGKKPPGA